MAGECREGDAQPVFETSPAHGLSGGFNNTRGELPTCSVVCWHCLRSLDCPLIWSHLWLVRWKLYFTNTENL